ncbi:MAG: hypothetical protein IIY78_07670 [Clostridia bacterium]|nr:hypothetical protein [Clostridia bacterium]
MDANEKVAYLKGLMDGLKFSEDNDTAKVLKAIIDVLGDFADEIDELSELYDELADQIDEIDQDLSIVEDDLYDEDDDIELDDFDEDAEYYEVHCPKCGDDICVSEDVLLDGGVECPSCGKKLEFDFSTLTEDSINAKDEDEE